MLNFNDLVLQLPPFGQLCFDDSDEDMDVDICDVLTPSRSCGPKQPLSPMMDEDSGIGGDSDDSDQVRHAHHTVTLIIKAHYTTLK